MQWRNVKEAGSDRSIGLDPGGAGGVVCRHSWPKYCYLVGSAYLIGLADPIFRMLPYLKVRGLSFASAPMPRGNA